MDYEQKHKEDLEDAKGWLAIAKENNNKLAIKILEKFFTELRESEDDRIREALFEHFGSYHSGSAITNDVMVEDVLVWLEKQGEKEPNGKVEPRFGVGDCIRYRGDNYKIKDIETTKNGFIYNVAVIGEPSDPEEVKSAIGCAVEKDIVKIEQQPKQEFGGGDEEILILDNIITAFKRIGENCEHYFSPDTAKVFEKTLKSLKDRVQPKSKQEWSEEDESFIEDITNVIIENYSILQSDKEKMIEWLRLRSLKPNHWKPSEEQMEALDKAKNSPANYHDIRLGLQSLYNDLKKL